LINPKQIIHENNIPWHMPEELILEIMSWEVGSKSPYGHSYYSVAPGEKDWNHTPLGCLRISDHWNFRSQGKIHCPTDCKVSNNSKWSLGRWDGNKYIILKSLDRRKFVDVPEHRLGSMDFRQRQNWLKAHNKKDISG
jgi:hypothetical protein